MFEEYFVDCCAPTLAAMKSASLFNCCYENYDPDALIVAWNQRFHRFGIHLCALRKDPVHRTVLVYMFRTSQMQQTLSCPLVRSFLSEYGYDHKGFGLYSCISILKERIAAEGGFPHEIGIFLGYPLCDVKGFIDNCGKNYKCLGPWKVYENEQQTKAMFEKYHKCRVVYTNLWESGKRSILQMTVAG